MAATSDIPGVAGWTNAAGCTVHGDEVGVGHAAWPGEPQPPAGLTLGDAVGGDNTV
jgi:hypothetical protein